jgi:hypothetical protein
MRWSQQMKRRDFLKSVTGVAAGAMVPAPAIRSAAKADARPKTLLIVSEGEPNNLDVHGIGTKVPGPRRGESWDKIRRNAYWAIRGMPIQRGC